MTPERTFVALVHHPVYDRNGQVVTTALTNLDLHDIARACRTYGLGGYFIVHPAPAQQALAGRILAHFSGAEGAERNDFRRQALEDVRVVPTLEEAEDDIAERLGQRPVRVATAARDAPGTVGYDLRIDESPALLLFGTGFGLTDEVLAGCRYRLEPVRGPSDYNHLSVRGACAIILDRLFGLRQK